MTARIHLAGILAVATAASLPRPIIAQPPATGGFIEAATSTAVRAAYGAAVEAEGSVHLVGYHQALHVATHVGQIRTIRNLYRKTRGEPARFVPENPTYSR
jgi:hypothetical protein